MPRHADPLQGHGPVYGARRQALLTECDRLQERMHRLDAELDRLARKRQALARTLRAQHRRLWPNLAKRGRRSLPDGRRALPPIGRHAVGLWGRELRAACRALLANGKLTLTEIHAQLHRQGYFVDSPHAVKALSDAMRVDVAKGVVCRVERGTYALAA